MVIKSKEDYLFYLEADRIAQSAYFRLGRPRLFGDDVWKFQRCLRKVEFLVNCGGGDRLSRISYMLARYNLHRLSVQLGFTIWLNTFGPGLSIAHRGTICAGGRVGENCRIFHNVTIGFGRRGDHIDQWRYNMSARERDENLPSIGNNVIIGPGAAILGPVKIADGIVIGANSYVGKSFTEPNITIAGVPAKKVSNVSSEHMWIRATDILRKEAEQKSARYNRRDSNRTSATLP